MGKQFSKGVRIWVKSGNRKPGRALRANRKTQRLLKGLLKRTDKVAARSRKRSKRARKLFRQAEREAAAPTG